jgi:hypothetical protein
MVFDASLGFAGEAEGKSEAEGKREAVSGRAVNGEWAWTCGKQRAGVRETQRKCERVGTSERAAEMRAGAKQRACVRETVSGYAEMRASAGVRRTTSACAGNSERKTTSVRAGNGERVCGNASERGRVENNERARGGNASTGNSCERSIVRSRMGVWICQ